MKLRVQLQCKNLHEYLRELNPEILDRLYNHPATCLAVYRELPSLAKNYVMRMLFLDQPLPQAAVALWCLKSFTCMTHCLILCPAYKLLLNCQILRRAPSLDRRARVVSLCL
uniref:General transcription factor IIH subunit 4 n=1 Tax=Amphilophus citrinellus TaxID=61819 RepID=A0A3Q0RPD9_AMPCI